MANQATTAPTDRNLQVIDVTNNNTSTSKHGFAPKLPNDATKYLNGVGAYTVPAGGGGSGTVTSVTAGDTSIVVGGTSTDPTIETATLDVIAADHPPAADWSNNSNKITDLLDPTDPQDAATMLYVDEVFAGDLFINSDIDLSTNPNYPPAAAGVAYHVSVAGKIGGSSGRVCDVEDLIVSLINNSGGSQAGAGANFIILDGKTSVNNSLALKAPLASPTFTGTPAAPTAAVDTNTTQVATTAMVLAQAAAATPLIDGTAAVGTSTRFARGDHVHPTDTTRLAATSTLDSIATAHATAADISMNSHKLTGVTDPTNPQDAATKNYVDTAIAGLDWKAACRLATAAALPTNTYSNGSSGVGATLTGVSFGALSVDGTTAVVGDRILVKNEVASANNGIYVVTTVGTVGTVFVLTRALDYNQTSEIQAGDAVFVTAGSTLLDTAWVMTTTGSVTVGTTAIVFTQFGAGANLVSSVFGRTGAVVSATNDYTDAQVQNSPTNKLTTTGDLLYASGANTLARLGVGSGSQVLGVSGGVPAWVAQLVTSVAGRTGVVTLAVADVSGAMAAATYDPAAIAQQVLGTTATQTVTNKRVTARTGTTTSSATPTINTDNVNGYSITALAAAITSFTTNLSGTPTDKQWLWIDITDNGTARALSWGASFEASGTVALPTTTVISTRLDVGFTWNTVTSKWRCVAVA